MEKTLDKMVTQAANTGNLAKGDWAWAWAEMARLKTEKSTT